MVAADHVGWLPRAVTSLASPNEQSLLLSLAHRNQYQFYISIILCIAFSFSAFLEAIVDEE